MKITSLSMKLISNNRVKTILNISFSILMGIVSFIAAYCICGCFYSINDDRYIAEILSGAMTGNAEPHAIYINYALGLIFAGLYTITTSIPWYGIFLTLCMIASLAVIFYGIISKAETFCGYIFSILSCVILASCCLYFMASFQYTAVSGMLAVAGYFVLMGPKKKSRIIGFTILELLAFLLRAKSMLFVQPMGFLVWIALYWAESKPFFSKDNLKGFIKDALCIAGIIVAIVGLSTAVNFGGYGSKEWKEYNAYNEARTYINDFCTGYSYDSIEDVLNEYNVSKEQFDLLFKKYWYVGNHVERECVIKAVEKLKDSSKNNSDIGIADIKNLAYQAITFGRYDDVKGFFYYNSILYCIALVAIVLCKKWRYVVPAICAGVSKAILISYLLYEKRYPFRVTGILFMAEMAFVLVTVLRLVLPLNDKAWKKYTWAGLVAVAGVVCIFTSYKVCQDVKATNQLDREYKEDLNQLFDYVDDKDGGYVIDIVSMMYYSGEVFDSNWYEHKNVLVSGGWFAGAPFMTKYEKEYLEEYKDNLYMVTSSYDEELESFIEQLQGGLNVTLFLDDEFVTDKGTTYTVWKINGI